MGLRLKIPRISQDVSTAREDTRRSGLVGRALSDVGRSIADVGVKVGSIVERREQEKKKSEISMKRRIYKAKLGETEKRIREEFENDPDTGFEEYKKTKEKLSQQMMQGVTDPQVQFELQSEKTIIDSAFDIRAESYKNLRRTKLFKEELTESAEFDRNQYLQTPPENVEDVINDIMYDLADIEWRSFSNEAKNAQAQQDTATRVDGAVEGYLRAYQFNKARDLVEKVPDYRDESILDKASYLRKIDQREQYYRNLQINKQRQVDEWLKDNNRKVLLQAEEAIREKVANPEADNNESFNKLRRLKEVKVKYNNSRSRKTMSARDKNRSSRLAVQFMEAISESDGPSYVTRKRINNNFFAGKLSAEDAEMALKSFKTRSDKKYKREEMSKSNSILREQNQSLNSIGFYETDQEEVARLMTIRDGIVQDFGYSPVDAAYIALNSAGKGELQRSGESYGHYGEVSLEAVKNHIIRVATGQGEYKKASPKEREAILKNLQKFETILRSNEYPTLLDLQQKKARGK